MQECPYCGEKTLSALKKLSVIKPMFNICSNCGNTSTYERPSKYKSAFSVGISVFLVLSLLEYLKLSSIKILRNTLLFSTIFILICIFELPRPYIKLEDVKTDKERLKKI